VRHTSQQGCLALELALCVRQRVKVFLDGDRLLEVQVPRLIDRPHAPLTEKRCDAIAMVEYVPNG